MRKVSVLEIRYSKTSIATNKRFTNNQVKTMGMDYYIENDKEYNSDTSFPEELSYLFEQIGGYGEWSVVSQVEKLLRIDLSIFQLTYNPQMELDDVNNYNRAEEVDYWIENKVLLAKVIEFIEKAEAGKGYFASVVLAKQIDSIEKKMNDSKLKSMSYDEIMEYMRIAHEEMIEYQTNNSESKFPPDNGMLDEHIILNGFMTLKKILAEFHENTVNKVRLIYM